MIWSFTPFATMLTTAAVDEGLSRRLTQAVGLIQFASLGGRGRRSGNGTVSIDAVSSIEAVSPISNLSPTPASGNPAATSKTCGASVTS